MLERTTKINIYYSFAYTQQSNLESVDMAEVSSRNLAELTVAPDRRDEEVRDMLLAVLRVLVDDADKVELIRVAVADGWVFQVRCAGNDVGKLIGKSGRTARAIRTLLSASAAKNGHRYTLDIAQ
jgi:uncharacterized protein